ncbi:hypothetical protein HYPBUDRAFT_150807 [Hyphopichia burtonii NRRL Y-1933]|uniref:DUF590-domain-containing protein n=1 Tax=Hyphopichia burtonii NRRL Y-1933 TaxID=984485 RepID=A0A1E4RCB3_9ASCO|nr:hypothetical protein HYPBUDRAFT_150807 [Hyphopichia burtonii NRRL Y-1933]ODV64876.1 hypothetical protein HYPBUDRAFT_150807 [Hyphopichia burtonii NRRL Y-1933]
MSAPLPTLHPDYVLSVEFPVQDAKLSLPSTEAKNNLEKLVTLLYEKGFASQVRSTGDSQSNLLLFIKLSTASLSELVEKDLIKNYEFGVTAKNDTEADKLRIIYQYLISPPSVQGVGITPGKGEWKFITSISPITSVLEDSSIIEDVKVNLTDSDFTTATLKDTFGVQISLYFEFLKFYIIWLFPLAVIGVVSYIKQKQSFSLTYAFINLVWGIGFLTFWNRKQHYLVNFWGVQNSHEVEEHYSQLATLNENFEEKSTYKRAPGNKDGYRFIKQLSFIPIALFFTAVLVSYQLACFVIEIFLAEIYNGPGKIFLTLVPTVLISVFVPILTIVFNLVTDQILAWEAHDNQYTKSNSVLIKTFVLNFLTSYAPLLITSFIYLPFAHLIEPNLKNIHSSIASHVDSNRYVYKYLTNLKSQKEFQINQGRLNVQFFYFIVTNQVVQLVMKYVLPLVLGPIIEFVTSLISGKPEVEYEIQDDEEEKSWLQNVRKAIKLPEYNVHDDFRGLALQYGYLIMFGPVWSLAPLISIVFNVITFKLDYLKLTNGKYYKPPVPQRVDSIQPWNYAFFLLTWLGSVISPVITAFYRHGTKPPKTIGQLALDKASINVNSSVFLILVLFASEHLFFILYLTGSKLSKLFKSQVEIDNDFVDNDLKLRRDFYSSKVQSNVEPGQDGDWSKFGVKSVLAAAAALPAKNVKTAELSRAAKEQEKEDEKVQEKREAEAKKTSDQAKSSSFEKSGLDASSGLKNRSQPSAGADANTDGNPINSAIAATSAAAGAAVASASAAVAQVTDKINGGDTSAEEKERLIKERQELLKKKEAELQKYGGALGDPSKLNSNKESGDTLIQSKDGTGNNVYATIDNNDHVPESSTNGESPASSSSSEGDEIQDESAINGTNASGSQADNFVANAKKTASDINGKVDDALTDGKVNKKKSSLKKLLKKKSSGSK